MTTIEQPCLSLRINTSGQHQWAPCLQLQKTNLVSSLTVNYFNSSIKEKLHSLGMQWLKELADNHHWLNYAWFKFCMWFKCLLVLVVWEWSGEGFRKFMDRSHILHFHFCFWSPLLHCIPTKFLFSYVNFKKFYLFHMFIIVCSLFQ